MTKKKSTKRALLLSALSLLVCVSMLIGSTFAWFTDSVTSAGNKIQAGTLDVQLLMHDGNNYVDISGSDKPIFGAGSVAQNNNAETLWEPGKTQVAYLAIKNNGNLALKYKVALDVYTTSADHKNLYEVMEYEIIPDAQPNAVTNWNGGNSVVLGKQIVSGSDSNVDVSMEPGSTHYFALAIHMLETAGNQYQDGEVSFDMTVLATQVEAEFDSFDNTYDANASYPLGKHSSSEKNLGDFKVKIDVPADAPEGEYEIGLPEGGIDISYDDAIATMSFEMDLLCDGQKVTDSGVAWPVTIQLPHPFVDVKELLHNGERIEEFTFDKATNTVRFVTTHFSPFEIKYVDYTDPSFELDYNGENGQYTITKGMFVDKNPVDFDSTLTGANSKYIVADFVKDGAKYYIVSERATTVFVAADATAEYKCESGTYNADNVEFRTNQSGKLWSVFSSLKANEFNTVYLLAGTYNEATTIGVSSSADIIGLGDTNEVKVIKAYSTGSNQHLFNCAGLKDDYIQVTLRNLCLDASEYNYKKATDTWGRDNAAVQSIRKTKVKCYDLTVVKNTAKSDQYAFYVNAKNDVNGSYYNAYMYVENCSLSVRGTSQVLSTSSTTGTKWYFYHSGLVYNETAYTTNSGNNKNVTMAADDWSWD